MRASLEKLVEHGDLDLDALHPGGLEITRELAHRCRILPGTRVLDVASGTGESACLLAEELGARVVGVDASDRMVGRARAKAVHKALAEVEFLPADAHRLPFEDGTFDAVLCECTLCLFEKERALAEMVRVARPGGYVGIHDLCWSDRAPERLKARLLETEGERPETFQGWKDLFERAGLADLELIDRSHLLRNWIGLTRKELAGLRQWRIFLRIVRRWGLRGLRTIRESARIFGSEHLGYGIVVGRKP